tara:strand:+ start:285 stop:632 length:348 start_codon:yes stop_codon:yes gene_type:complete
MKQFFKPFILIVYLLSEINLYSSSEMNSIIDSTWTIEYIYDGNNKSKNLENIKLYNGDFLIFDDGIFKQVKMISHGLKINNSKQGEWLYFNKNGFPKKIIQYKNDTKIKEIEFLN